MRSKRGLSFFRSHIYATVPPGQRIYAIGDIHGCIDPLKSLMTAIARDARRTSEEVSLVFLGDYVDRGPDAKGVVDYLLGVASEFKTYFVRGNHDQALLDFIADPQSYLGWKDFGAGETLRSYGVAAPETLHEDTLIALRDGLLRALPETHLHFFSHLLPLVEIGDYVLVHAGIDPIKPLAQQNARDLMEIRETFLSSDADFGKVVVHGHTPGGSPVHRDNRICIDTGVYITGKLTAVRLRGTSTRFLRS
jgi:serine/threonine protein phosphatase 1